METSPLSDLFDGGGRIVTPAAPGQRLLDLDRGDVIRAFERHGVLVFRGFGLLGSELAQLTDRFTESYIAADLAERERRFGQNMVRSVSPGRQDILLHSEASYAATWPEILWFYCHIPPVAGGQTTLCDGLRLWNKLPRAIQKTFLAQPVRYEYEMEIGPRPSEGTMEWRFPTPGVSGWLDKKPGIFHLTVERFAVHESRLPKSNPLADVPAFANYLLLSGWNGRGHSDIKRIAMADGTPIDPAMVAEVNDIAAELTYDLAWQPCDLVMLDNRRFMHGRRGYPDDDPRDIVQIQTARASFAFGETTRRTVAPRPEAP